MKILYICRLFSGFEESLKTGIWNPKGAPTVAKMLSYLDQSETHELRIIMTAKDYNSTWDKKTDQIIKIDGLKTPIQVLAGSNYFPAWFWKFRDKFRDLRQCLIICAQVQKFKPDLIYCDRVNIFPAAVLTRTTKIPVIWRVMGVLEEMHGALKSKRLRSHFYRFLVRSPFAAVICSLDGSGGQLWMEKSLHPSVNKHMLVNGYDHDLEPATIPLPVSEKVSILFAGRLEKLKGLDVFLNAIKNLKETGNTEFRVLVAGYGSQYPWMRQKVEDYGLNDLFVFLGGLTAEQMKYVRLQSNIYVSCGTHGNMTNTTIEALSDGLCTVVPEPNKISGVDVETDAFLSEKAALRYGPQADDEALAKSLEKLINSRELREKYAKAAREFSQTHISSWDNRISQEIELLNSCIRHAC